MLPRSEVKKVSGGQYACPPKALSMDTEPSWEVVGPWSNPGYRAYFQNCTKCNTWWVVSTAGCATCLAVCPFSQKDRSFIHRVVAPTISTMPTPCPPRPCSLISLILLASSIELTLNIELCSCFSLLSWRQSPAEFLHQFGELLCPLPALL